MGALTKERRVKSWVTEATDISWGHRVAGPPGKSRWPGKVLGH